jgi:two-component system phosphate regulon sensor histidine kinase PhoR
MQKKTAIILTLIAQVVCLIVLVTIGLLLSPAVAWLPVVLEPVVLVGVGVVMLVMLVVLQGKLLRWLFDYVLRSKIDKSGAFVNLYERSPVAYLVVDRDGMVLNANPAAVHLLRSNLTDISAVNLFTQMQAEEEAAVIIGKTTAGATVSDVEVSLDTVEGTRIWVLYSAHPYGQGGRQRLVSLVDYTQQKIVDTAKSEFVALATHQLRTPIAAIRWNVELLERKLSDADKERLSGYLDKTNRNILRMIALINDFLSVSKLEMGTFATKDESVDLTEFFAGITEEFAEKIEGKRVTFVRQDEPEHFVIKSDPRLLHIIVSNLVSNAVKYTKTEGHVWLLYKIEGQRVSITVADDGIGVPQSEQEQLFSKFFRATNARSHQTEGTGLGLYAVQQAVEILGGTIGVNSEEDKGTNFQVSLPL